MSLKFNETLSSARKERSNFTGSSIKSNRKCSIKTNDTNKGGKNNCIPYIIASSSGIIKFFGEAGWLAATNKKRKIKRKSERNIFKRAFGCMAEFIYMYRSSRAFSGYLREKQFSFVFSRRRITKVFKWISCSSLFSLKNEKYEKKAKNRRGGYAV